LWYEPTKKKFLNQAILSAAGSWGKHCNIYMNDLGIVFCVHFCLPLGNIVQHPYIHIIPSIFSSILLKKKLFRKCLVPSSFIICWYNPGIIWVLPLKGLASYQDGNIIVWKLTTNHLILVFKVISENNLSIDYLSLGEIACRKIFFCQRFLKIYFSR
jgi:hypothetical protein